MKFTVIGAATSTAWPLSSVGVENSLVYYAALRVARVPAEAHLFAIGGHGYGLRSTPQPITGWPHLAEAWLRALGVLSK